MKSVVIAAFLVLLSGCGDDYERLSKANEKAQQTAEAAQKAAKEAREYAAQAEQRALVAERKIEQLEKEKDGAVGTVKSILYAVGIISFLLLSIKPFRNIAYRFIFNKIPYKPRSFDNKSK